MRCPLAKPRRPVRTEILPPGPSSLGWCTSRCCGTQTAVAPSGQAGPAFNRHRLGTFSSSPRHQCRLRFALLGMCIGVSQPAFPVLAEAPLGGLGLLRDGGQSMNKAEKYRARVRHCREMAARARHDDDKRSWLLLAETWLDMTPERQRAAGDRFDAVLRDRRVGLRAVDLRPVR